MSKWHKIFSGGHEDNRPKKDRSVKEFDEKPVKVLDDTIREDNLQALLEYGNSQIVCPSHSSDTSRLGMHRVSAPWIPPLISRTLCILCGTKWLIKYSSIILFYSIYQSKLINDHLINILSSRFTHIPHNT